jgi:hypothetical protein
MTSDTIITGPDDIGDTDLTNTLVKVRPTYTTDPAGVFLCSGGFGCKPNSNGKVFGRYLATNEVTFTRRHWIDGWATPNDEVTAEEWSSQPKPALYAEISNNIMRNANTSVEEVARDDAGRVTKEQMRAIMFNLLIDLGTQHQMMKEVADESAE